MHRVSPIIIANALAALSFTCPGCGQVHTLNVDPAQSPCWEWNGNLEAPTFKSSIKASSGPDWICHSYVTDGQIRFEADSTHQFAGQTLELAAFEPTAETIEFLTGSGRTVAPTLEIAQPAAAPVESQAAAALAAADAQIKPAPALDAREAMGVANAKLRTTVMSIAGACDRLGQALGYEDPAHALAAAESIIAGFGQAAREANEVADAFFKLAAEKTPA